MEEYEIKLVQGNTVKQSAGCKLFQKIEYTGSKDVQDQY